MSITLKDIAMRAGVSQMTVSRILNGKARGQVSPEVAARVQTVAGELKYRSNRIDRKLDSFLAGDASAAELPRITVLTPYPDFLERGGGAAGRLNAILPSVFQTAAEAGGMVEILPVTKENDPNRIEWPWLNRFGAGSRILALSPWFLVPLAELSRRGARIALIQGEEFWRNMTLRYAAEWAILTYRNRQGYEILAEKLLREGYSRIAVTVYDEYRHEPDYPSLTGVSNVLAGHGISYLHPVVQKEKAYDVAAFARAYRENPFDALTFIAPKGIEWNYRKTLQENLSLPDSVKIVFGNDNQDARRFSPPLPNMSYPLPEMAAQAVKLLLSDDFTPGERLFSGIFNDPVAPERRKKT